MEYIKTSMYGLVCMHAERKRDKMAYLDDNRRLSWGDVKRKTDNLIAKFSAFGMRPGSTAAVFLKRSLDTPLVLTALRALGVLTVILSPEAATDDDIPVIRAQYAGAYLLGAAQEGGWWCDKGVGRVYFDTEDNGEPDLKGIDLRYESIIGEPSFIIYTAGSTGATKGVAVTEYALINQASTQAAAAEMSEDEVMMCMLPMHHIWGIIAIAASLCLSFSVFFARTREPGYVLRAAEKYGCTRMDAVPTFFMMAVETARRLKAELKTLRGGVLAGSSYSPEQFYAIEDSLGIRLCPAYGMTEMTTSICSPLVSDPRELRARSVGKFSPGVDGVIKTPAGERVTAPYIEGEICCKGYPLMAGYVSESGELYLPVDGEGYFHTGDLGYMDERGYVYLTGRCKDIIIRGGENLSSAQIAAAIADIDGVSDAVVVGISDRKYGENVGALVVTDRYDREELLSLLREKLKKCEVPAGLVISDRIPLSEAGKPDKKTIRRLIEEARDNG